MSKPVVKIECESKALMDPAQMLEFQGEDFKILTDNAYEQLKGEIVDQGFSYPIAIWKSGKKNYILDGHQRKRVLMRMREEGWEVPKVPISIIKAKSYKQAKMKLLAAVSQYGRLNPQGLYEFLHEAKLDLAEIVERVRLPEIDLDLFSAEFFEEPSFKGDATDPEKIGDYDADKDYYSIRVNKVPPTLKDKVIHAVNDALEKAGLDLAAEAY